MLELILVRHGETDSNVRGTYCGWTDVCLNEKGIIQAQRAAESLKDTKLDFIYASPLQRVYKTAEIINSHHNMEIMCYDSIKEHNFGIWEDLTHAEVLEKYPEQYSQWQKDWINYCIEGGESVSDRYDRVVKFVQDLLDRHKKGTILVVTHGGCIRHILSYLLGLSIDGTWRFYIENGGISKVTVNDEGFAYLKGLNV